MNELVKEKKEISEVKPKIVWKSKTAWSALLIAIAGFFPIASDWIEVNPTLFAKLVGGLFLALRFITKDKVVIK